MSRLLDDNDELPPRERELTLSTGAILAIFLGLVLLCGVFFGFGYNLGRKSGTASNASIAAASQPDTDAANNSGFDNFKSAPTPSNKPDAPDANDSPAPRPAEKQPAAIKETAEPAPARPTAATARPTPAVPKTNPTTGTTTATTRPAAPAITPGGTFMVQIAAISPTHKDDADLLANALHGKGYPVAERTESQDKLIHLQVGPFATKAEAEAMRERLIVDGYNAIVK